MSLLSLGLGLVGYEAERVCRSVQEERPSCSTSGGQSSGGGELWGARLGLGLGKGEGTGGTGGGFFGL